MFWRGISITLCVLGLLFIIEGALIAGIVMGVFAAIVLQQVENSETFQ
jgi:hypothetical protein